MKIIHIVWSMSFGGAETMLMDIARVQAETDEVHILAINSENNPEMMRRLDPRIRFYCCRRKRKSHSLLPFLKLNAYLWRQHPDIVHAHFLDLYKYIYYPGIKVRTIHNTNNNPKEFLHYRMCYAISQSVVDEWKPYGHPIRLVTNGIDCSAIARASWSFTPGKKMHFIQVSRLFIKQKGQDILIDAIAKVRNTLKVRGITEPPFLMHFVGEGPDEQLLRKKVEELSLQDLISFDGLKDRWWVYDHLRDFDLFIQPSRFEGFGLTVAEACAAKIPVLVSDTEGPREILDDGTLGWTFANGNPGALADALLCMIDGQYDTELIEKAYNRTRRKYDVRNTALKYLDEYRRLLPSR